MRHPDTEQWPIDRNEQQFKSELPAFTGQKEYAALVDNIMRLATRPPKRRSK